MLKRGDIFSWKGEKDICVVLRELFPNGGISLTYRMKSGEAVYGGRNIKDCKNIMIFGNVSQYVPEEFDSSKLDLEKIMDAAEEEYSKGNMRFSIKV